MKKTSREILKAISYYFIGVLTGTLGVTVDIYDGYYIFESLFSIYLASSIILIICLIYLLIKLKEESE